MKFIKYLFIFTLICIVLGVATIFGFYRHVEADLPDVAELQEVQLQTPMQVLSQDGKLIAQFGEKRRLPMRLDQMPPMLVNAFIATEDSRFYSHFGFDPIGITRAAYAVFQSGTASQGASTITQQLARNFFLSNEKKIMRKIKEIFIAVHIEMQLSKEEILELYLNKIYLGYRSYGVGAAARSYFGKELDQLTLSEMAMIAGLPKAPSTLNPIYSLERATQRRNIVLARMLDEGYISQQQYDQARSETLIGKYHGAEIEVNAPYIAEIARAWMVERYGEEAYTSGMRVITTIRSDLQEAADKAALNNLFNYDVRHGYRGAEQVVWQSGETAFSSQQIEKHLKNQPTYGALIPAIVTQVNAKSADIWLKDIGQKTLDWDGMKWARRYNTDRHQGAAPRKAGDILAAGEQVWVRLKESNDASSDANKEHWMLSQVPLANTAFVAMNPDRGAVLSLIGGFNFTHSKFNRATQSVRQVGSGIKPFIYAAALDKGLTLATLVNDAPINHWDESIGTAWRPKNSPPTYYGPTRLRIGLAQSKNVMAVRVLREVGVENARNYLSRFGFDLSKLPSSETLALGAGSLTPVKLAQGYSVFANGGHYVEPYYIERIEDPYGEEVYKATPKIVCHSQCSESDNELIAPQVITQQNAFLVREMLYANVWGGRGWRGTGWRAQSLKRHDVGGKTGTTNDSKDAWYNGFGPGIVATSWVGFDTHDRDLGRTSRNDNLGKDQSPGGESGGKTAQPAWVEFMHTALKNTKEQSIKAPADIVQLRIDRESGLLTEENDSSTMLEYFRQGTEPTTFVPTEADNIYTSTDGSEELF
ncbi:penicillin-binding protein 1A [Vibrio sp. RC27]